MSDECCITCYLFCINLFSFTIVYLVPGPGVGGKGDSKLNRMFSASLALASTPLLVAVWVV